MLNAPVGINGLIETGPYIYETMLFNICFDLSMFAFKTCLPVNLFAYKPVCQPLCCTTIRLYSRTPAFGGISLALRGLGALGAPVRAPAAPIWATAAFGGGERKKIK